MSPFDNLEGFERKSLEAEIADLRAKLEQAERQYANSQNTVGELTRAAEKSEELDQLRLDALAQAEARAQRLEKVIRENVCTAAVCYLHDCAELRAALTQGENKNEG